MKNPCRHCLFGCLDLCGTYSPCPSKRRYNRKLLILHCVAVFIACAVVWFVLGKRNEMYSEADCPPECEMVHQ